MIEVEYKYAIDSVDSLLSELTRLNATFIETVHQEDTYFNHNSDNFKEKDIAFRVRVCRRKTGSVTRLTYKGPNQDAVGKIREEHEVSLTEENAAEILQTILAGVGFESVAPVRKQRDRYRLDLVGEAIELCLDQVEGLGAFVELEIVVNAQSQVENAKMRLTKLSQTLGLQDPIRTSYLDLLLDKN